MTIVYDKTVTQARSTKMLAKLSPLQQKPKVET